MRRDEGDEEAGAGQIASDYTENQDLFILRLRLSQPLSETKLQISMSVADRSPAKCQLCIFMLKQL